MSHYLLIKDAEVFVYVGPDVVRVPDVEVTSRPHRMDDTTGKQNFLLM